MASAASGTRACSGSDGDERATACPVNTGHEGLACTACTDFFGTFCWPVGWPPRRVLVCHMGMSSGRGTLTVTFCDRHSRRVYYACRELRLRLRARVHEDQADGESDGGLVKEGKVFANRASSRWSDGTNKNNAIVHPAGGVARCDAAAELPAPKTLREEDMSA